jgi:DNA modification methylase
VSTYRILHGDVREQLRTLPAESVQTVVTSPPYWGLRDYGVPGQLGLEETPEAYVAAMVDVFREVRRVLRHDGTLWLNLGDSYAGSWGAQGRQGKTGALAGRSACAARQIAAAAKRASGTGSLSRTPGLKPKDLVGIPWRVAFALQADGWWLRSDIIWAKPNPMPESVTDRPTRSHEYLFLLTRAESYFYDAEAVREFLARPELAGQRRRMGPTAERPGGERQDQGRTAPYSRDGKRNLRSVWTVATQPFPEAHFATFPEALVLPCVLAGSRPGDTVLDPFSGSGTTGVVALKQGRSYVGVELNPEYVAMSERRLAQVAPLLVRRAEVAS